MDTDHDDIDEDIERLKIVLEDDEEEGAESDGELRVLGDGMRVIYLVTTSSRY